MIDHLPEPGSFRDPSGHVYEIDGQIFRSVTENAAQDYEFLRERGILKRLAEERRLVPAVEVQPAPQGW